jgi:hypothetical protein
LKLREREIRATEKRERDEGEKRNGSHRKEREEDKERWRKL